MATGDGLTVAVHGRWRSHGGMELKAMDGWWCTWRSAGTMQVGGRTPTVQRGGRRSERVRSGGRRELEATDAGELSTHRKPGRAGIGGRWRSRGE
jgi:hypothetical protein